jgi:hypothetical protein
VRHRQHRQHPGNGLHLDGCTRVTGHGTPLGREINC